MHEEPLQGEVTDFLRAWAAGRQGAFEELVPLVYDRMRRLAASFLRNERCDHTLQTTALIHEAFLRLVGQQGVRYQNREQFFANVGRMMRRILVDHARARLVKKRGGGAVPISEELLRQMPVPERPVDLVALDDALVELEAEQPELARVVELRFFVGLSGGEIARVTGRGTATVQRRWKLARAWLYKRLRTVSERDASSV